MKFLALTACVAVAAHALAEEVVFEASCPNVDMASRSVQTVELPTDATNWTKHTWLSFEVTNLDDEGGILRVQMLGPKDRKNSNLRVFELPAGASRRVSTSIGQFFLKNRADIRRILFSLEEGAARRFAVTRIVRGRKGEPRPESTLPPPPRTTKAHAAAFAAFLRTCEEAGSATNGFAVGVAHAGVAVRPRGDFRAEAATRAKISLARNEYEAIQVLVAPCGNAPLKGVRVEVFALVSEKGEVFASSNVSSSVMGYVNLLEPAAYKVRDLDGKIGWPERTWHPDPILDFIRTADVEPGDVQAFWIRVKCPAGQSAGRYAGNVRVVAAGGESYSFPIEVRVRDFDIPLAPPLDMAMCFNPRHFGLPESQSLKNDPDAPINVWKRHKTEWCDFLAEYFITMDNIYLKSEPDWEMLERLKRRGRIGRFNLGYWAGASRGGSFKALADKARSIGVFEHAYSYGCDERPKKDWPVIARGMSAIKAVEPNLPLLTTTRDDTFGEKSSLTNVVFVQCVEFWNEASVAKAQKDGRKIWWYICSDPKAPGPNVFVECPPVEARLLMGAMAQKFRPDGFLYYALALWRSRPPIADGPFTEWNARNREWYHGDGCLTYCGPDGTPLASQHLENFRDGLEDLWYAKLLQEKLCIVESEKLKVESAGGGEWIRRARAALAVPKEIVNSLTDFCIDPAVLYRWRDEMADLIEEAK